MTISPAAQAVLDAYGNQIGGTDAMMGSERRGVAAALRAAVHQVLPEQDFPHSWSRMVFLAIADELEGHGQA